MKTEFQSFVRMELLSGLLAVLSLSPVAVPAQSAPSPSSSSSISTLGEFKVEGIRVAELDSKHLRIAVDLSTTPTRTVTLENLYLDGLRLNGLPAFAEPLEQPIDLIRNKKVTLPPVYVNALIRDFTSVEPLRTMIKNQTVHVQGQIVASVKMSFFEKLGLRTQHPRVFLTIDEQVPVVIGSSRFERQAALGALSLVDFAMRGRDKFKRDVPGMESAWLQDLRTEGNAGLMQVETQYQFKEHGNTYPRESGALGFRLNSGVVVTTGEAAEPWEYDADFQGRIKSGKMKLEKKQTKIELRSVGSDRASTEQLSFLLEDRGGVEKEPIILQKNQTQDGRADDYQRVMVAKRASARNIAVLKLQNASTPTGFSAAPSTTLEQDQWEHVAVYRIIPGESMLKERSEDTVDIVELSARRDGQSIRFDHPLDSSFLGSPVVTAAGVIGVVQDQRVGAILPIDLARP